MEKENSNSNLSIVEHWIGKDCVQLIDPANNQNSIFVRFVHNDNDEIKAKKINDGKENLIEDRIKSNIKNARNI